MNRGRYFELRRVVTELKLDESHAVTLAGILANDFHWAGSAFTSEEIESALGSLVEADYELQAEAIAARKSEIVAWVKEDRRWTDAIGERTSGVGLDIIDGILIEAIESTRPAGS